jgi:hypothetical protein
MGSIRLPQGYRGALLHKPSLRAGGSPITRRFEPDQTSLIYGTVQISYSSHHELQGLRVSDLANGHRRTMPYLGAMEVLLRAFRSIGRLGGSCIACWPIARPSGR